MVLTRRAFQAKNLFHLIFLFVFSAVVLEIFSFLALVVLKELFLVSYKPVRSQSLSESHQKILASVLTNQFSYFIPSATLGWAIRPNGSTNLYRANSYGLRADRDYDFFPSPGVIRIAAFGDSHVHGDEVTNENTWEERLVKLKPNLEVLNFGVGGYGFDQAYLRYQKEGVAFHPQIVLIGFASENIYRVVNTFRPFYSPDDGLPFSKPRFLIDKSDLKLLENPLAHLSDYEYFLKNEQEVLEQLGRHDYYYQMKYREGKFDFFSFMKLAKILKFQIGKRFLKGGILRDGVFQNAAYNSDSEAFEVTKRIMERFYHEVIQNGSLPVIVFLPTRDDAFRFYKRNEKIYSPLVAFCEEKGYRYVDLTNGLRTIKRFESVSELFKGHYSELGNKFIANYLGTYLEGEGLIAPDAE